jgi:hypothetical protein
VGESGSEKRRITLELSEDLLGWIDGLKSQMGFRNRGLIVEQLLRELVPELDDDDDGSLDDAAAILEDKQSAGEPDHQPELDAVAEGGAVTEDSQPEASSPTADLASMATGTGVAGESEADDDAAIVLIGTSKISRRDPKRVSSEKSDQRVVRTGSAVGVGIQLPGFVRRQARAVKRSLAEQVAPAGDERNAGLALIPAEALQEALVRAQQHWLEIYGTPPSDAAQDAALTWLARDLWPQSDHSDGRPFSWGLAQKVLLSFAPSWTVGEPSLDRVITAAGILEDPFGASSLAVRVPTLITRFVQRQRSKQKRSTSFEAIDQSMTVHGALRLLQLPTIADRPYTLKEIREAYREQAQNHHPDAGGSADAMRRLNEAYQFLKERYRQAD